MPTLALISAALLGITNAGCASAVEQQANTQQSVTATNQIRAISGTNQLQLISGHVTDVDTHEPIPHFTVTPGSLALAADMLPWRTPEAIQGTNGVFYIKREPLELEALRIQVPGYMPEMVRKTNVLNGESIQLRRGQFITGRVLGLKQQPLEGAQVALLILGTSVQIGSNGLSRFPDQQFGSYELQISPMTTTDGLGEFKLPACPGRRSLVVSSEEGYAIVKLDKFEQSKTIQLERWGKVMGTLTRETKPVANKSIGISETDSSSGLLYPFSASTTTDVQGRFTFDRLPSGKMRLSYLEIKPQTLAVLVVEPGSDVQTNLAVSKSN